MVKVLIPSVLQNLTNSSEVESEGSNLKEVIANLEKEFEGMEKRLLDEDGEIRKFLSIFVDNNQATLDTKVEANSEVNIIPAVSGG